jgi:hypothetical protein
MLFRGVGKPFFVYYLKREINGDTSVLQHPDINGEAFYSMIWWSRLDSSGVD